MPEEYEPLPMPHDMPPRSQNEVVREELVVSPSLSALLLERAHKAHVLVMPRRYGRADLQGSPELAARVPYSDSDMRAVDVMRHAGLDIDYLNDADEKTVEAQFGTDVVIAIGLFICQALAEEEIQTIYRYLKSRVAQAVAAAKQRDVHPLGEMQLVKPRIRHGNVSFEAERLSGPAEQVVEIVRQVLRETKPNGS